MTHSIGPSGTAAAPVPHTLASVGSAPPTPIPASGTTCAAAMPTNVGYNPHTYQMLMSPHMFPHVPGFFPAHGSTLPNSFVQHNMSHNFAIPNMGSSMNGDFLYNGGQYPILGTSSQSCSSAGTPGHMGPPGPPPNMGAAGVQGLPYPHYHPSHSGGPKKTSSCWNCGQLGHWGQDCKEASIEEMTSKRPPKPNIH